MEVNIVLRSDRSAIQRGRLKVPLAQSGFDLFVDAMTDRLHNFGFDDAALRVDGDFDDDVSDDVARKRIPVNGRIGINSGISNVDFVSGHWTINHGSKRRTGMGIMVAGFGIRERLFRLFNRSCWLGMQTRLVRTLGKDQLGRISSIGMIGIIGRKVDELVVVGAVSVGQPQRFEVNRCPVAQRDDCEERQMCSYRQADRAVAAEF